jgi:nucleotide-binding universal stress UspA family protein
MAKKILCPTDLTGNSKDSVGYAFSLARRNSAQLIILHITSFPTLSQYPSCELGYFHQWEQFACRFKADHVFAEGERRVREFIRAKFAAESDGVEWKPRITLGRVSEEILLAAFQQEVDLIVLARRKGRKLTRLFTRSVSETVSKNAPCPVLSIDATQFVRLSLARRVPLLGEIV